MISSKVASLLVLASVSSGAAFLAPVTAFASTTIPNELSASQISTLKSEFSMQGIPPATQAKLISKIEHGQILDGANPSMLKQIPAGALRVSPNHPESSYTMPDGSVVSLKLKVLSHRQVKLSAPNTNTNMTMVTSNSTLSPSVSNTSGSGTSGGTESGGSGYANFYGVKVYASYADVAYAYFYSDFTVVEGGQSYITQAYQDSVNTSVGYSLSSKSLSVIQKYEDVGTGQPAQAQMNFDVVAYKGLGNYQYQLTLNVGSSTYWVEALPY